MRFIVVDEDERHNGDIGTGVLFDPANGVEDQVVDALHAKRFEIACQEAKSKVNSVWVIVFTASMSTELSNCASSPSQAATVTTSAALISKFEEIGRNIGALRLTQ